MELYHLALQRLFGSNIFQLHTIMEFAGPKGSGKSALAFFIAGLFLAHKYNAVLIETENKLSPSLLVSILGPELFERLLIFDKCTQLEKWQAKMSFTLDKYENSYKASLKAHNDAIKARNKCTKQESKDKIEIPPVEAPLLIVLDSLGAALSQETSNAIKSDGYASKAFPVEALKNSKYFSDLPDKIRDIPVTVLYTNHKMVHLGDDTVDDKSKGGSTPAFFCSHRFFFEEMGAVLNPKTNHFQQFMRVECKKNSLNQRCKPMRLLMEWDKWIENGDECQSTRFGWPELLTQILAPKAAGFSYDREEMKKFLTVLYHSDAKFSCKELNIKDPVSPREMGERIESDRELAAKVAPYLGIKRWSTFNVNKPAVGREEETVAKSK